MIVTIDVGNSNIVIVVYNNNDQQVMKLREETKKENAKQYYEELFLRVKNGINDKIEGVIIASVVPLITMQLLDLCQTIFGIKPYNVKPSNIPEFVIHLDNPDELGADFIASAYGAISKNMIPAVIADMGSATKLSIIDDNRQFLGGVIIPGIQVASEALVQFIPHLPEITLQLPRDIIGHDTISSMQSGLLYGVVGSVEGITNRIEKKLNKKMHRILTGGYSNIVNEEMKEHQFEPTLVNDGLLYLFRKAKVNYER
jgi:type III pantothenate kinase